MGMIFKDDDEAELAQPVTANAGMLRQMMRQRASNPRPDVTDFAGWGNSWEEYGQNFVRNASQHLEGLGTPENLTGPFGAGIVKPALARTLTTPRAMKWTPALERATANTRGAARDDEGLLLNVRRSQKPDQQGQWSTRGGVFYTPSASGNARHYAAPTRGKRAGWELVHGGSETFTGDTLLSNPLAVYGASGGNVPEQAYRYLKGKEALGKLHRDVIRTAMPRHLYRDPPPYSYLVDKTDEFLEEYAPEMAGRGSDIMWNSQEGNRLRYALQESAIGSAARRENFDAILGYSHGYGHPTRFSEVFDLREKTYPSNVVETELWSQYLPKVNPAGGGLFDDTLVEWLKKP
jgi:hypothetical protein